MSQIGNIPHHWLTAKLGTVIAFAYGKGLPQRVRESSGTVNVFGSSGEVGTHSDSLVNHPTIIVGRKGSVGAVYLSEEPCWPIDTVFFSELCELIDLKFMMLQLDYLRLGSLDQSTTIPSLSRDDLNEVIVKLAPVNEQRRIVAEIEKQFSRLDVGVSALKRVEANLKRYNAAILKAACTGELTADWRAANPDVEPASKLLDRILRQRRRKWEEAELAKMIAKGKPPKDDKWKAKYKEPVGPKTAELPPLPKTWTWATVEQVCSEIVDCPHATPKWTANGKICVRTTEFRPGKLLLDEARFVSDETFESRVARLRPAAGDILYSREGGILGIACMVPDGTELCLGQRMMQIRAAIDARLLMHVLNSPFTITGVKRLTGGSASPHLNVRDIKQFAVPVPPVEEQRVLADCVDDAMSIIQAVTTAVDSNARRASRLRQAILRDAFSGMLVPQDPTDEPAAALLERIRSTSANSSQRKPRKAMSPRARKHPKRAPKARKSAP